ncbi:MAG: exo-alpha-sialidase [Acidobacteriota bacterium]
MSEVLVMVGTQKGAFFLWSGEERREWRIEGPILKGWEVSCLEVDPRREPTIYAGVGHYVYGATIQRSTDWGKTWEQLEARPRYAEGAEQKLNRIWAIAPGRPEEPETLYAGIDEAGLFRSTDLAESWQALDGLNQHPTRSAWGPGAGGLCCHTILLDPANAERMWVGISAVGAFRSDDGGTTWQLRNDGLSVAAPSEEHPQVGSCVHNMVLDPSQSDLLYQQNHQGVFRSSDGGDSWQRCENGVPSQFGFPMVMHPRDGRSLFIVPQESDEYRMAIDGQLAVYRSRDAGDSWHACTQGLPGNCYQGVLRNAMAVDPLDPCGVYFGTTGGQVFWSADEGDSWQAVPCQLPRIASITAVTVER